jgi:hypothetical protein
MVLESGLESGLDLFVVDLFVVDLFVVDLFGYTFHIFFIMFF